MNIPESTQVLIVGGGPVGLMLANLLGREGVNTVLIERNPGCVPEPRAIAIDGECMRTLQAAGLVDIVLPTVRQGFVAEYFNGEGDFLFRMDMTSRPYGFALLNSFDQPTLERQLLKGLERFDCVHAFHETSLVDFDQDAQGVTVTVRHRDQAPRQLRADYLAGCDGGRSSVRQQLGISMSGDRLPQKWLVIDTVDHHLTDEPECRFYCDPARPGMTLLRPQGERRWEWMLVGDETDEEMLEDNRIRELLAEHTDPDQVEVYRKCVYGFSAVVAERFSDGRVFLAGDAAHMTPPFAGQGLNAGIRDVRNLSWKLARVLEGNFSAGLLDSYNLERHDAAREMVEVAVMLGDQIQPTDAAAAAERDAMFAAINEDPEAAEAFSRDITAPLMDVRMPQGWRGDDDCAGRMLPQPPISQADTGLRLDDTLDPGFIALTTGDDRIADAIVGHPLWQAMQPSVHRLPAELEDFAGLAPGELLLVRPDRFVLARLPVGAAGLRQLDALQTALSQEQLMTAATGQV
jgi:3-(3-hydroxy-phenyl)propionate hydroxylase